VSLYHIVRPLIDENDTYAMNVQAILERYIGGQACTCYIGGQAWT
jgi:hypothetical protein